LSLANARADKNAAKVSELDKSLAEMKLRAEETENQLLPLQLQRSSRCRSHSMHRGGQSYRIVETRICP
jgi:hypothetical protein